MTSAFSRRDVSRAKIVEYLLNDAHALGGAKAAFFKRLGFEAGDWGALKESLLEHPDRNPVAETIRTIFGTKYVVRCSIASPDFRNPCIVTVWMVEDGAGTARLVTAYPFDG